jgi:hypothetical protein
MFWQSALDGLGLKAAELETVEVGRTELVAVTSPPAAPGSVRRDDAQVFSRTSFSIDNCPIPKP